MKRLAVKKGCYRNNGGAVDFIFTSGITFRFEMRHFI